MGGLGGTNHFVDRYRGRFLDGSPSTAWPPMVLNSPDVLDFDRWEAHLPDIHRDFAAAQPYPHVVLDDFLDPSVAKISVEEFPPLDAAVWRHNIHVNQHKFALNKRGFIRPTLRHVIDTLNGERFLRWVSRVSGISGLLPDEALEGG